MTFANNLDPDEAPQNVGLHLRSKLFDIQIIYQQKKMGGNNEFFENFERNKYLKKLPSMQWVKQSCRLWCIHFPQSFFKAEPKAFLWSFFAIENYIFLVSNSKVSSHLNTTWRCDFTVIICMYLVNIWKCLIWQLCRVYPDAMTRCAQLITVSWIHNVTLQQ